MDNKFLALEIVKALQKNGVEFIQSAVFIVNGVLEKHQPEKKVPGSFKSKKIIEDDLIDD